ncbi:MAG: hypothetical protein V4760_15890 [Bdellovibrionota bacterium]
MTTLEASQALSNGRITWLVPDLEHSKWAQRIDWYLNFQITRAEPHRPASFAPELQEIMEKWEFEAPAVRLNSVAPLMIASPELVPNHQTVVIPVRGSEAEWVLSCHRVWVGLGRPAVRLFLPEGFKTSSVESRWPKADAEADVELVGEL